jgi:hypothetical protein
MHRRAEGRRARVANCRTRAVQIPVAWCETPSFAKRLSSPRVCLVYSGRTPMSARHSHRWIAWLLPLFLLRAFIPVGFMLSWSDAGLQLVMCSGSGPMTGQRGLTALAAPHQQSTDAHHQSGQHQHSRADGASMCPFAAAATAGALPSFAAVAAFAATVSSEALEAPYQYLPSAPVLIDRIRGPPLA